MVLQDQGARRAGRGVNNVKIVETIRMFDFAIALGLQVFLDGGYPIE